MLLSATSEGLVLEPLSRRLEGWRASRALLAVRRLDAPSDMAASGVEYDCCASPTRCARTAAA